MQGAQNDLHIMIQKEAKGMKPALLMLLAPAVLMMAAVWADHAAEPAKALPGGGTIRIHVDAE